ncbi:hypothetical protein RJT34_30349 [Clitoria ternatea]|uniref:Uncharacterized protein n=1 Tax=Clitoria ternatea TaxID=43366 RepID=A0AAN9ES76_CLITE
MPWIFLPHHHSLFFSLFENPNPGSSFTLLSLSSSTRSGIKVVEWKNLRSGMGQISCSHGGFLTTETGTSLDSV